ncbi:uncharacterized protein LOC132712895 [Ruditapes philippinarum]|uniref:uncharacterized protein LOC132712895 n=1 Tax=Ruditapes philippinarum TaxID=129788 RepID=UPI00295B4A9F|nr:uncharacterized protein LOC132712895 [Ruditapes philippinarum]
MKITVIFLAILIVYVKSESCTSSIDVCTVTSCRNSTLHCVDNKCTCLSTPTRQKCVVRSDCYSAVADADHHHCRVDSTGAVIFHCIDNICRCEPNFHTGN